MAQPSQPPPDASISQASALAYWNTVPASVDGMLGGLPHVSRTDLQGSAAFLAQLLRQRRPPPPTRQAPLGRVADCGAGIGRITRGLLSAQATTVDVVEPVKKFTDALAAGGALPEGKLGDVYNVGLEAWTPPPDGRYDAIWNQWCLGQLTDAQLRAYLARCKPALREGGWIVVKENVSTHPAGEDIFDAVDSSVTRAHGKFLDIFAQAGLKVVATEVQKSWPKDLFPVRMYALQPEDEP